MQSTVAIGQTKAGHQLRVIIALTKNENDGVYCIKYTLQYSSQVKQVKINARKHIRPVCALPLRKNLEGCAGCTENSTQNIGHAHKDYRNTYFHFVIALSFSESFLNLF